MYRILLDDKFYNNQPNGNKYLHELLDVIKKYFDAKIVIFEPFNANVRTYNLLSNGERINLEILKTRKIEKLNLSDVIPAGNDFLSELGFDEMFIGKINYILKKYPLDYIIIPYV